MYFSRIFYMVPTLSWDRFLPKNGLWSGHIYFKSSWCLRHDDSYFDVSGAPNNTNCIIVVLGQVGPGSKILRRSARKMPKVKYSGNIRKYCFVSTCHNSSSKTPEKQFFCVPSDTKTRLRWAKAAERISDDYLTSKNRWHCCQDHFKASLFNPAVWSYTYVP